MVITADCNNTVHVRVQSVQANIQNWVSTDSTYRHHEAFYEEDINQEFFNTNYQGYDVAL